LTVIFEQPDSGLGVPSFYSDHISTVQGSLCHELENSWQWHRTRIIRILSSEIKYVLYV